MITMQTLLNKMTVIVSEYIAKGYTIRPSNYSYGNIVSFVELAKPNSKTYYRVAIEVNSRGYNEFNVVRLSVREKAGEHTSLGSYKTEEYYTREWSTQPATVLFTKEEAQNISMISEERKRTRRVSQVRNIDPEVLLPLIRRQKGWSRVKPSEIAALRSGKDIVVRKIKGTGRITFRPRLNQVEIYK